MYTSVVDPKLCFSDPEPTFQIISDPYPDPTKFLFKDLSTTLFNSGDELLLKECLPGKYFSL